MLARRIHWFFILPALLFVLLLTLYPSVHTILLSFTNRSLVERGYSFVGWKNYRELLFSPDFWSSLRITLLYVLATIFLQLSLGLALALVTDHPRPGVKLVRTLVLICWVIPEVIVALTFKWMFVGDRYGLVNAFLLQTGLVRVSIEWLSNGGLTLLLAIGMTVWRGTAFSMIMQAAALKGVPEELHEAAEIDGARALQKFTRITLPLISSTILINLIIISIATFNVMSLVYAFSGGGPFRTTELISIYMYKTAFKFFRFGYASSLSVVMFLLNIMFTVIYIKATRKDFLA
jgi:multiple sugar transport system permease protein